MAILKTQVEAANGNRVALVAEAQGRKAVILHNDTAVALHVSLGEDGAANINLPLIAGPARDTTFKSFTIAAGTSREIQQGAGEPMVGFFASADSGKFVRITQVF